MRAAAEMDIRLAGESDLPYLAQADQHITPTELHRVVSAGRAVRGWLRCLSHVDCGSLLLPGEPLEILFRKTLD